MSFVTMTFFSLVVGMLLLWNPLNFAFALGFVAFNSVKLNGWRSPDLDVALLII